MIKVNNPHNTNMSSWTKTWNALLSDRGARLDNRRSIQGLLMVESNHNLTGTQWRRFDLLCPWHYKIPRHHNHRPSLSVLQPHLRICKTYLPGCCQLTATTRRNIFQWVVEEIPFVQLFLKWHDTNELQTFWFLNQQRCVLMEQHNTTRQKKTNKIDW